jgi:DNA replication and repair protein RecF
MDVFMHIKRIKLKDFRNYESLDISVGQHNNLFFGNNAQGKSNLLEAVYFLAFLSSCRTQKNEEAARWGTPGFYVMAELERGGRRQVIEVSFSDAGKKLKINSKRRHRFPPLDESVKIVSFLPTDPDVIMGAAMSRRRFLNIEISQIDAAYRHYLSRYQPILFQRNSVLKRRRHTKISDGELSAWSRQLVEAGAHIIKKRKAIIDKISGVAAQIHSRLTKGKESLVINYAPSFNIDNEIEKEFNAGLEKNLEKETRLGMTLTGPHRDNYIILVNNRDVSVFGSRAQKRSVALSVRLAWVELIKSIIKEPPVVLLDDILSELDPARRESVLEFLRPYEAQCFVTATDPSLVSAGLNGAAVFQVDNNKVVHRP